MSNNISDKIETICKLNDNTPNGIIVDADTILADVVSNANCEVNGLAECLFNIWGYSRDKYSVEETFYNLTGVEFEEYIDRCLNEITRL